MKLFMLTTNNLQDRIDSLLQEQYTLFTSVEYTFPLKAAQLAKLNDLSDKIKKLRSVKEQCHDLINKVLTEC